MEDSRLLTLLDKYATAPEAQFPETCMELLGLIAKYLSKSEKIKLDEAERTQLKAYLTKRLLNGSTSDDPKLQDRYLTTLRLILKSPNLKSYFDSTDTLSQINALCSTANAIKKSERKYFGLSHVHNLVHFFVHSQNTTVDVLRPQLDKFLQEPKEGLYFVAATLASLANQQFSANELEKLKVLVEDLLQRKVPGESYRHAAYLLALQNLIKTHKLKVNQAKFEALEQACAALASAKNISKFFDEIVADDSLNITLSVPLFETLCLNILARPSDKPLAKLFRFFQNALSTIMKDKAQRQKRAFHLLGFLRVFLTHIDPQLLLAMDLDQSLKAKGATEGAAEGEDQDASSIADVFITLIEFWVKQFGNKNPESKRSSLELDHALSDRIKSLDKEQAIKIALFFLKILKHNATNSLRGGDMRVMNTLLSLVYQDEKAFNQYFSMLVAHVKSCTKISELNFYLNELEHLGQTSLSAKQIKGSSGEREVALRSSVLKFLVELFVSCDTEDSLDAYLGSKNKLEWNEQDLSFRKFRSKAFERILNLVFKRDDPALLTKAADIYAKYASKKGEGMQAYFSKLLEAAEKLAKQKPELSNLIRALVFQNVFEDDAERNKEIMDDIVTSCQLMNAPSDKPSKKSKPNNEQKPEDVFVDSLIALCSMAHTQLKHIISASFECVCQRVTKIGFSLLFQAVIRPDNDYLADDGGEDVSEDGEDNQEEEDEEAGIGLNDILDDEDDQTKSHQQNHANPGLGKRQNPSAKHGLELNGNGKNGEHGKSAESLTSQKQHNRKHSDSKKVE